MLTDTLVNQNLYDREKLIQELRIEMGENLIDGDLGPAEYDHAVTMAFEVFRQRSSNSVEEKFVFMELQPDQSTYYLPAEVMEVRQIHRRGVGGQTTGGGTQLDPFAMAYTNLYLREGGKQGGLLSFDLFHQYQEVAGRLFGRELQFTWNQPNRSLIVHRQVRTAETVVLWAFAYRSEVELLQDIYVRPWIRKYALAECKKVLGLAYSKFTTIVGPTGGTTLPGDQLKQEAIAEIEKLEQDLMNYVNGETPLSFVIG